MADTVAKQWIYPTNWNGEYPWIGEEASSQRHGWKKMVVRLLNLSDGTGESLVPKLVREDFYGVEGKPCLKIGIDKIIYQTYGMSVKLEYDMSPNQLIAVLPESNSGMIRGPILPDIGEDTVYGPGETGNVLLSTIAHTANDSYDIVLHLRIKE
jgi:hypothetical protein